MDWFEKLTGFRESTYAETRARLRVAEGRLHSLVNGSQHGIGKLSLISLADLRAQTADTGSVGGRLKASIVVGDVRLMHHDTSNAGALFQVASQFNLLEMVSPDVTPERGVTRYAHDGTQGPACAIAAGAATIYRNYFAPVGDAEGQTAERQHDGLADMGDALCASLGTGIDQLWQMRNGYALASKSGLAAISRHLTACDDAEIDRLRGLLRIGLHSDVEVTDAPGPDRPYVSQAFCSALPVSYGVQSPDWEGFARLVLEAAYEATFCAAVLNAGAGGSNRVFLTLLGGGAFGNRGAWIYDALERAMHMFAACDLDIRLVSYGAPSRESETLVSRYG